MREKLFPVDSGKIYIELLRLDSYYVKQPEPEPDEEPDLRRDEVARQDEFLSEAIQRSVRRLRTLLPDDLDLADGWVPSDQAGSERKSITWLECEKAKGNGKEILAFLVDEKHIWPDDLREENRVAQAIKQGTASPEFIAEVQDNVKRLRQFKTWLDSLGIRAKFTTPDSLMTEVLDALRAWKQRRAE